MIRIVSCSSASTAASVVAGGGFRRCAADSKSAHYTLAQRVCPSLSNNIVRPLLRSRQYCSVATRTMQRRNSCINRCSQSNLWSSQKSRVEQRRFLATSSRAGRSAGGKGKLSRRERRERKALKRHDRSNIESNSGATPVLHSSLLKSNQGGSSMTTSGRKVPLPDRNQIMSISLRVPPFLLLLYGTMFSSGHPQYGYGYGMSPGGIVMGLGASMIPAILPHDLVLWECISYRLLPDVVRRELQVGDVVIYVVDKEKGIFGARYITKRIVATEGMKVDRRGQHADLYGKNMNFGILPDSNNTQDMVEDDVYLARYGKQADNTPEEEKQLISVPKGHIWLEGDNPLYSIDSRHYGPIPVTSVRGRVIVRLFPWSSASDGEYQTEGRDEEKKEGKKRPGFGFFGLKRPNPPSMQDLTGGKYNCFRAPVPGEGEA